MNEDEFLRQVARQLGLKVLFGEVRVLALIFRAEGHGVIGAAQAIIGEIGLAA